MKNQGVWINRIIALALTVFIVSFMGYHLLHALYNPIRTVTAVLISPEDTIPFNGIFIRSEELLPLPEGSLHMLVADGERVHAGQSVAVVYDTTTALENGNELRELEKLVERINYVKTHDSISSGTGLDSQIRAAMLSIMSSTDSSKLSHVDGDAQYLKSLLMRREFTVGQTLNLDSLLADTERQIEELTAELKVTSETVKVSKAGIYCSTSDGLETKVDYNDIISLTVEKFKDFYAQKPSFDTSNGKISTNHMYYYAAVLPQNAASMLKTTVEMRFEDEISSFTLKMNLESISLPVDGQCVVLLSSQEAQSRFIGKRKMYSDAIMSKNQGIRIPKDAIRVDNETGKQYVYCVVLTQVVRKDVSIILSVERENYLLVEYDPSDTDNVLPGDEVIIAGKDLYDGKVVE